MEIFILGCYPVLFCGVRRPQGDEGKFKQKIVEEKSMRFHA